MGQLKDLLMQRTEDQIGFDEKPLDLLRKPKKGRKKIPKQNKKRLVTVSLDPDVYEWLYLRPSKISTYVNGLLKQQMPKYQKK